MTMAKSVAIQAGLILMALIAAGCSGEATTQQLRMSGTDRNYPHPGVVTGEDGKGLVYSSDRKQAGEMSPEDAAATADMSEEEKEKYFEWKAEKERQEFEAWKKAQQDPEGS